MGKIIRVSDREYDIPCSVCQETAVKIKIGMPQYEKKEYLIIHGLTHTKHIEPEYWEIIFSFLNKNDISAFHSFIKYEVEKEGLDAYCPQCDKIYCWKHYNVSQAFEDGFYDCSYGICPLNHRRIIDD